MALTLSSLVSTMRGVGEARAAALASLGIMTVYDLVRHYPRGYQLRGDVRTVAEAAAAAREGLEAPVSLVLTVAAEPSFRTIRRGMSILRFRAFDESGVVEVTFFNQIYLKNTFHTGGEFRFYGRVSAEGKMLKMASPVWEACGGGRELPDIVPVYPLAAGLTQKFLSQLIRDGLSAVSGQIAETLPPDVLRGESLCALPYAIQNIHHPEDTAALARARRRLVFEEFFEMGLAVAGLSQAQSDAVPPCAVTDAGPLIRSLPYALTGAQTRAIAEIASDLGSGRRMNRILTGDVGSGKTVVAAAAAYMAVRSGYQCAIMAPTEILAAQHAETLAPMLGALGIGVVLLTGSATAAQKKKARAAIAAGPGADVAIGTHALLSESVTFARLGLVIEDEQHRFGVMQRAALAEKSGRAHMLVMSATPIPRTLSLLAYGGLKVSKLDELPPGRQTVDTFVVDESYRERLNGFIRRQAEAGHQVYVVCPSEEEEKKEKRPEDAEALTNLLLTEEAERPPLKAAVEHAAALSAAFPDLTVGYVHGKMKPAEKEAAMRDFTEGKMDILVSTTVIEVGVNVPNATLMIVENAERFGLAQLHQLRGRVGRGEAKSYCVLVSDAEGEIARRRLETIRRERDGYAIAEADLRLRGPGDFLRADGAVRQHGTMPMALAATAEDAGVTEAAFRAASALLAADPTLSAPDHAVLREAVQAVRQRTLNTVN